MNRPREGRFPGPYEQRPTPEPLDSLKLCHQHFAGTVSVAEKPRGTAVELMKSLQLPNKPVTKECVDVNLPLHRVN